MMTIPAYVPMDCAQYSRLEWAILRQHPVRLRWRWRGLTHLERIFPIDLRTRRHAEYLLLFDHAARRRIVRLDRIMGFDDLA